jgi:phosphatidylglycerol:prolipoprotein diacylglycerol transferase
MTDISIILAIAFPDIGPELVRIGPFAIRWYALAYIAGLVLGWLYIRSLAARPPALLTREQADDLLLWVTLGVVLGGRLGSVLFYNADYYLDHPLDALKIWRGGMSFHGGLLGVAAAMIWFARRRGISPFAVSDFVSCAVPIGLFFGRISNFINGELWGRTTDVPWAVVFPHPNANGLPRHPSQLYEALLEGLVLFVLLFVLARTTRMRHRPGLMTGVFCMGYGAARIFVEFFRQPDVNLGFLAGGATMGQLLSVPLFLFGAGVVLWARRRAPI